MGEQQVKEAYIDLAGVEEFKKQIPPGGKGGYNFGFVAPMARLLSSHPTLGPTFHAHFANVMFGPGALSRAEREMVAAVAAAAQDCHY